MTFLVRLSRVDRSAYRFWLFGDKNFEPWLLVDFDNIVFVGRRVRRWYASVLGCLWWLNALQRQSKVKWYYSTDAAQKSCHIYTKQFTNILYAAYSMLFHGSWSQNFRLSLYIASLLRFTINKIIKITVATGITISRPFISFSFIKTFQRVYLKSLWTPVDLIQNLSSTP